MRTTARASPKKTKKKNVQALACSIAKDDTMCRYYRFRLAPMDRSTGQERQMGDAANRSPCKCHVHVHAEHSSALYDKYLARACT